MKRREHYNTASQNEIGTATMESWRRKRQPTPVFLPGKSHEERSLVGYSPWGCKELDITEHAHYQWEIDKVKRGEVSKEREPQTSKMNPYPYTQSLLRNHLWEFPGSPVV